MRLIITSSGIDADIAEKLDSLNLKPRPELALGVIINAQKYKSRQEFESRIDAHIKSLNDLGYSKTDIIDMDDSQAVDLRKYDVVYIVGGNNFYLLDSIRRNNFTQKIKDYVKGNGILIGQSAGSYVMCPNISMGHWKSQDNDIVGLTDLDALNLVPFLVTAHYEDSIRDSVEKGAQESDLPTYALKDGQALFVEDEEIEFINGKPLLINGTK